MCQSIVVLGQVVGEQPHRIELWAGTVSSEFAFKAFAALDVAARARLEADITALLDELNVAGPDSLVVPAEYLEVVIATA